MSGCDQSAGFHRPPPHVCVTLPSLPPKSPAVEPGGTFSYPYLPSATLFDNNLSTSPFNPSSVTLPFGSFGFHEMQPPIGCHCKLGRNGKRQEACRRIRWNLEGKMEGWDCSGVRDKELGTWLSNRDRLCNWARKTSSSRRPFLSSADSTLSSSTTRIARICLERHPPIPRPITSVDGQCWCASFLHHLSDKMKQFLTCGAQGHHRGNLGVAASFEGRNTCASSCRIAGPNAAAKFRSSRSHWQCSPPPPPPHPSTSFALWC